MSNKVEDIGIINRANSFFNVKNFDRNSLKIYKKSYKKFTTLDM